MNPQDVLLIVYLADNKATTSINPRDLTYRHFGLLIADTVRHVAKAFNVSEDEVWEWVEKERDKPSTEIEGGRAN